VRSYWPCPLVRDSGEVWAGLFFGHSQGRLQRTGRSARSRGHRRSGRRRHQQQPKCSVRHGRLSEAAAPQERGMGGCRQNKEEFLAMLGQELRQPLAPIRNALASLTWSERPARSTQGATEDDGRQLNNVRWSMAFWTYVRASRAARSSCARKDRLVRVLQRAPKPLAPHRREWHTDHSTPDEPGSHGADPVRLEQVIANCGTTGQVYGRGGPHFTVGRLERAERWW